MREIKTCRGQIIKIGSQVAYATPPSVAYATRPGITEVSMRHGHLSVAKVTGLEVRPGWAEMDPFVKLTLDNGHVVDCEDVVVTDGEFRYA